MPGSMIIIGRTGQVARALAVAAQQAGYSLTQIGREALDLEQGERIAPVLEPVLARSGTNTILVNAAAYTDVNRAESEAGRAQAVNAVAPGQIAGLCAQAGIPMIHLSTDYVHDGCLGRAYGEQDVCNPLNVYGRTKLAGEVAVQEAGGAHLILRTSSVFSATGRNFLTTILRLAETQDQLRVVDDQVSCPTSADDIAAALVELARRLPADGASGGALNFCGDTPRSWAGFASDIIAAFNRARDRSVVVEPILSKDYPSPAERPACSVLDCRAIREQFGVEQPAYGVAIRKVLSRVLG
tara:strand:+ start:20094 stop:20987 length:894 start_codon:yes stop_codon:yes gene_type:complete